MPKMVRLVDGSLKTGAGRFFTGDVLPLEGPVMERMLAAGQLELVAPPKPPKPKRRAKKKADDEG